MDGISPEVGVAAARGLHWALDRTPHSFKYFLFLSRKRELYTFTGRCVSVFNRRSPFQRVINDLTDTLDEHRASEVQRTSVNQVVIRLDADPTRVAI